MYLFSIEKRLKYIFLVLYRTQNYYKNEHVQYIPTYFAIFYHNMYY